MELEAIKQMQTSFTVHGLNCSFHEIQEVINNYMTKFLEVHWFIYFFLQTVNGTFS